MKIFFVALLLILLVVSVASAEQRVITIYTQATWGGDAPFLEYDCKALCFKNGDINDWLNNGWRVTGTNYARAEQRPFKSNSGWCRCTGTEYVLER